MSSTTLGSLFVLGDSISMQYGPYLERAIGSRLTYARKSLLDGAPANGGDSSAVRGFLEAWVQTVQAARQPESATDDPAPVGPVESSPGGSTPAAAPGAASTDSDNFAIPTKPVDYLLVNCGLHDIKTDPATGSRQIDPDRYRANLAAVVAAGRSVARSMFWVRTTPVDETIHNTRSQAFYRFTQDAVAYNAIADEVMASLEVDAIDLHGLTMGLGTAEEVFCDHVHFTETVRKAQAAYIAGFLQCVLNRRGAASQRTY